jgi:hypothetical protein
MLIVTALSVIVATMMSVVAWRVMREERRRAEARVAALAEDIHLAPSASPEVELALNETPRVPVNDLFSAASAAGPRRSRIAAVVGGGALVVATAAVAIVTLSSATRHTTAAKPPAAAAAAPAEAAPLELVALGHEREDDRLTVHGVVRNPAGGAEVSHLTAVVLLFNQSGGFVTSGRASIEATALEPGAEAPFVVIVPGASDVGRYRVSFRTDDRVVPHIDRRS